MKSSVTILLGLMLLCVGLLTLFNPQWIPQGALQTEAVRRGEIGRIFTSIVLHANLPHLWINLMLVCFIGFGLEPRIGRGRFVVIFIAGGIGGALLHLLIEDPVVLALGASGGIYALLGALIGLLHRQRAHLARLEHLYLYILVALAFGGIIAGFAVNALPDFPLRAGNAAHIGGGLTGFALGWWLNQSHAAPAEAMLTPD